MLAVALCPSVVTAQGTIIPAVAIQFFDNNGDPCGACQLNAYAAGTTTRQNTYSEVTLTTANANPVVLDANGRAVIYLSATTYRFVLTNSSGGTTYWDRDNVTSIPTTSGNVDITGTAGAAIAANDVVYLSDGSGSLTAGRWYPADADNTYSSNTAFLVGVAPSAISSAASGTIRLVGRVTGLSGLTAGELYYASATAGALVAAPPTNARFIGKADSTTTLVIGGGTGAVTLPDSDGTHTFTFLTTSNATEDRRVTINPGDVNRQIVLSGNLTVSGNPTVSQDYSTTGDPTFDQLTVTSCTGCDVAILNTVNGRCTLTSGTAVTSTDVTAATTLYFALYKGNQIALYNGSSAWNLRTIAELSIAVPATTNTAYDVFVDDNGGTPALEVVAWTNLTTRATALATQNGVYVQTGDTDSRYVCSFRTTGVSGQTEDSRVKRYVWSAYNRVPRLLERLEATASWAYSTATVRQANGSTSNQVEIMVGLAEDAFTLTLIAFSENNMADIPRRAGIGEGTTTAFMSTSMIGGLSINALAASNRVPHIMTIAKVPAVGHQYYSWNEWATATGTTTWTATDTGAQAGLQGWILG